MGDDSKDLRRIEKVLTAPGKHDAKLSCIDEIQAKHAGNRKALRLLQHVVDSTNEPEDWEVRNQAVIALGATGNKGCLPQLITALTDRSPIVRESAAYALGQVPDPKALPALLAALDDESFTVRENSARTLAKIGDARAIESLLAKATDGDLEVRLSVISAVGTLAEQHADARLLDTLVGALRDDEMQVRFPAIIAFNKIKHALAIPSLVENLESDDPLLQKVAADALVYNLGWGSVADGKLTSFGEKRRDLLLGAMARKEAGAPDLPALPARDAFAHLADSISTLLRLDEDEARKLTSWLARLDERYHVVEHPGTAERGKDA